MRSLRLEQDRTLRIEDGVGVVVEVAQGEVWLTQERDPRDYFLRAGDWMRIDRRETVVLSATGGDAWLSLIPLETSQLAPGASCVSAESP